MSVGGRRDDADGPVCVRGPTRSAPSTPWGTQGTEVTGLRSRRPASANPCCHGRSVSRDLSRLQDVTGRSGTTFDHSQPPVSTNWSTAGRIRRPARQYLSTDPETGTSLARATSPFARLDGSGVRRASGRNKTQLGSHARSFATQVCQGTSPLRASERGVRCSAPRRGEAFGLAVGIEASRPSALLDRRRTGAPPRCPADQVSGRSPGRTRPPSPMSAVRLSARGFLSAYRRCVVFERAAGNSPRKSRPSCA